MLRHMLMESLQLKFLCENITFVLKRIINFAHLLIGHNYVHLKSGAFSLGMSIFIVRFEKVGAILELCCLSERQSYCP